MIVGIFVEEENWRSEKNKDYLISKEFHERRLMNYWSIISFKVSLSLVISYKLFLLIYIMIEYKKRRL